jgi:hypothetical protein
MKNDTTNQLTLSALATKLKKRFCNNIINNNNDNNDNNNNNNKMAKGACAWARLPRGI